MCGNWGVLCLLEFLRHHDDRTARGMLPELLERLILGMIRVIELRGAQAGGVNLLLGTDHSVQQCRERALKPKRGDLGSKVFGKLRRALRWARVKAFFTGHWFGAAYRQVLVQGHSRFGTSSSPAVMETHPHQWSPPEKTSYWSWTYEDGWQRRVCTYSLTITHNGDFDAWTPYRRSTVGVGDMSLWLSRVLAVENTTKGDSRNIAGTVELLACQGMWYQSVRQAYHLHIATHVEQASGWMPLTRDAPHNVPDKHTLHMWADIMEKEFEKIVKLDGTLTVLAEDGGKLKEFCENCVEKLCEGRSGVLLKQWMGLSKARPFVLAAVEGFRDNDLLSVTTAFLRRAEGTFGISVTSTLTPETVIIAARGQPMSIGFGGCLQGGHPTIAYWSSEPAAMQTLNKDGLMINKRFDLNDQIGEVIELRAANITDVGPWSIGVGINNPFAISIDNADVMNDDVTKLLALRGVDFYCGTEDCKESQWYPNLLTRESFQKRLIPIAETPPTQGPSKLTDRIGTCASKQDCVAKDISHIPWIVDEIDTTWSDSDSLNRISSDNFSEHLLRALTRKEQGHLARTNVKNDTRPLDLVVFGVETSLWLGQQFVADLQSLFPSLNILAISSNVLLGLLQKGAGHLKPANWTYSEDTLRIDNHTMGFAISHSGTTYPTVWAARLFRQRTRNLFALSNSFDGLLACSIGQGPNQTFEGLLFSSLAGTRPAEAATVTTVAMHHTLSHLLLQCAASATKTTLPSLREHSRFAIVEGVADDELDDIDIQDHSSEVCTASKMNVKDMHRLLLSMYRGVSSACGVDALGQEISGGRKELVSAGHRWSHHITEGYWATFLPAIYVIITVIPGFLPATEFGTWFADRLADDDAYDLPEYANWLLRVLDSFLYVFMGIIVAMLHRRFTGRRLWARFTSRTILLVESTANYKMLRAYTSKLVALSYRFATISVVGQNGADHMVHEYTHKAQSDVLLAVGLPDGRLPTAAPVEGCVLMSSSQAQFIKQTGHGVEAYCLGHNTWTRPNMFVRALKLPTFRPLFASEKLLFTDQLHASSEVVPGHHGTSPGEIVQRHKDLLKKDLDPFGMPQLQMTPNDLKHYMDLEDVVSFEKASSMLEDIIENHFLAAHIEMCPCLRLKTFLSQFMSEHRVSTRVIVHSPFKSYAVSDAQSFHDLFMSEGSPTKNFLEEVASPRGPSSQLKQRTLDGQDAIHNRLSLLLDKGDGGKRAPVGFMENQEISPDDGVLAPSSHLSASMDANEFLALLRGNELQTWVRSARYRWNKICAIRGLLSQLADEEHMSKRSRGSAVLADGRSLHVFMHAWRKTARKIRQPTKVQKPTTAKSAGTVQMAAIDESKRATNFSETSLARSSGVTDHGEIRAAGKLIGDALVNSGAVESDILQESRPVEMFYENRVGSAERLVAWFVLLHAMARPSSRLPFLNFELGKSESRLRVASTPAPVPLHDLESAQEEFKEDVTERFEDREEFSTNMSI